MKVQLCSSRAVWNVFAS